jgi:hypothetical protein
MVAIEGIGEVLDRAPGAWIVTEVLSPSPLMGDGPLTCGSSLTPDHDLLLESVPDRLAWFRTMAPFARLPVRVTSNWIWY